MEKGDLILTPAGLWHEHGHEGTGPVVWLDALDLPLVRLLEATYAVEGEPQAVRNEPDSSQSRYRRAGLVPYRTFETPRPRYPLLRFPWAEVREALTDLAAITPHGALVRRCLRQSRDRPRLHARPGLFGDHAAAGRNRHRSRATPPPRCCM